MPPRTHLFLVTSVPPKNQPELYRFASEKPSYQPLPLLLNPVRAGFPSPAEDFAESSLDLNEYLIHHPAATFFLRVAGDSMVNAGIHPGDILIVDRALEPKVGQIVIAVVNGEFTVKRLGLKAGKFYLKAENPSYPPIILSSEMELELRGVVTCVLHQV